RICDQHNRASYINKDNVLKINEILNVRDIDDIVNGNEYSAKIKKIDINYYDGYVYDISTSTENFIANSFYSHNCTYIRSDSTFIVPEVIQSMRGSIPGRFGADYLPSKTHSYSNKANAQEAHEAIRVTDILVEDIPGTDGKRLYELIWKRTMASQMEKMAQRRGSADFNCEKYVLTTSGSKITFDGWSKAWNYGNFDNSELPELKIGEKMKLISINAEQKFTQPPPRYSEQSLIKEIEKRGIGRPSTYKNIIKTLVDRKYTEKKKKVLHVTEMGVGVSDFLIASNFCFVDLDFTENMESDLDCIAKGDCEKLDVLTNFWDRLSCDLNNAKEVKNSMSKTDYPCPKCEEKGRTGNLVLKNSKYGKFYGCSNRKEFECDYKADVGKGGEPIEKTAPVIEESDFNCPSCGELLLKRKSKKNWEYLGCRNWNSEEDCKGFFDKETGEKIVFKKKKYKKWKK
ncbi:MAG: topoisomerase DNA-binding C4 zinc finger domain-containing protein, partial [Clostridiales bacterium]|nr:topoisomerase DNA-binding C4 zinc finger domain-containing protein [Clostridiales bacterium]